MFVWLKQIFESPDMIYKVFQQYYLLLLNTLYALNLSSRK